MSKLFFQPVDPWFVAQPFGVNWACISNTDNKTVIGCDGNNPPEGYRSVYGNMKGHNGWDVAAKLWQPVYAAQAGEVVEISTEEERGLGIGIYHDLGHQGKWKTRYWHLIALNVQMGEKVHTGQFIGYAGDTGYATGPHLHFEIKPQAEKGVNLYPDNGFFGAVDPLPLMLSVPAWKQNFLRQILEMGAKGLDGLSDFLRAWK